MEWKVPSHGMPSATGPIRDADALLHLARGLVGEGDGEDVERARLAGGDEMGDARRQHARLAGAGAGQDEHRPVGRLDGGALLGVEAGEVGRSARPRHARARSGTGTGVWLEIVGQIGSVFRLIYLARTMDQNANGVEGAGGPILSRHDAVWNRLEAGRIDSPSSRFLRREMSHARPRHSRGRLLFRDDRSSPRPGREQQIRDINRSIESQQRNLREQQSNQFEANQFRQDLSLGSAMRRILTPPIRPGRICAPGQLAAECPTRNSVVLPRPRPSRRALTCGPTLPRACEAF